MANALTGGLASDETVKAAFAVVNKAYENIGKARKGMKYVQDAINVAEAFSVKGDIELVRGLAGILDASAGITSWLKLIGIKDYMKMLADMVKAIASGIQKIDDEAARKNVTGMVECECPLPFPKRSFGGVDVKECDCCLGKGAFGI